MIENSLKKISRLLSILMHLQDNKLLTASKLAEKFGVSIRTIYRDIKILEQVGIPVITEEGKGYRLMRGYRFPPLMLSENEANALVTAERLISKNKEASFVQGYTGAMAKIKAILRYTTKDRANLLEERTYFYNNEAKERTSNHLSSIQYALTNYLLLRIEYEDGNKNKTLRDIEPFALIHTSGENWLLLAWCRIRKDYRSFRLDRILKLEITDTKFEPHQMTLEQYFEKYFNVPFNP